LDNREIEIDVFLGQLWGLSLAKIHFENLEELRSFKLPPFAVLEVTESEFFIGKNLIGKTFADVQAEFEKIKNKLSQK
jgi:CYTH domain-containing protein